MNEVVLAGLTVLMWGLLIVSVVPYGAPRPSLAYQLAALRAVSPEAPALRSPVFGLPVLEEHLRPVLEQTGAGLLNLAGHLGFGGEATRRRLALAAEEQGVELFWGQKFAGGLFAFALLPALAQLGVLPQTPLGVWIAAGVAGFVGPEAALRRKAEAARVRMREELVRLLDLMTLAVSAGLGLEDAITAVCSNQPGRLFGEVRVAARQADYFGESLPAALGRLPERTGMEELEPFVAGIAAASAQGVSITNTLRAHARALRRRRHDELIAAGQRAPVRMLVPVAVCILPAFLLLILFPAVVQMLGAIGSL